MMKKAVGVYSHRPFTCSSLQVKFLGVIGHFVCFYANEDCGFVNFIWRNNKGSLFAG